MATIPTNTLCGKCNSSNSNESTFCKNCGNQIKCRNCQYPFELDANFCSNCGEGKFFPSTTSSAPNKVEYSQKGNSKNLVATFTNEVGVFLANAINSVVTGQPIQNKNPFHRGLNQTSKSVIQLTGNNKDVIDNIQDAEVVNEDYSETIAKIFKENSEGKLEIIDNRFKEKSQRDKVKRLTLLYMFASKLQGIELVSRGNINEVVNQEKITLQHFRDFLSKDSSKYIAQKEGGNLALLAGGEEEAKKILIEIANPNFIASVSKAGRKAGKKAATNDTKHTDGSIAKKTDSLSALEMCKLLINEGFFENHKKLSDIVNHISVKKGINFSSQNISMALKRLLKDEVLDRDKKDGEYEYWKK